MGDLKRAGVGPAKIIFFVIAAAAPLTGTLGALPIAIGLGSGQATPFAFIVVGALLLVFSVGYSKMTPHVPQAGAFYAYISAGLGGHVGTGAAVVAIVSYAALQLGLYGLFGFFCHVIAPESWTKVPWWTFAILPLFVTHLLGQRQIDASAKVLGILMTLEMGIVLIVSLAIVLLAPAGALTLQPLDPAKAFPHGVGVTIMFAFACFIGFEATGIYAPEARDPNRTIPQATIGSVLIIALFFATVSWAAVIAYGPAGVRDAALADPGNFWFVIAERSLGRPAVVVMKALLLGSIFASILAFHNALARYYHALAQDRVLWLKLGETHPVHQSPYRAAQFQTATATAFLGVAAITGIDPYSGLFSWTAGFATLGIMIVQFLVSLAILRFFRTTDTVNSILSIRLAPIISLLGLAAGIYFIIGNLTILVGSATKYVYLLPIAQVTLLVIGSTRRRVRDSDTTISGYTKSPGL